MSEHTPGPWELFHDASGDHDHEWSLQDGQQALLLFNRNPNIPPEQAKANALVIAAADDLLTAAQMLEDAEDKRQHCDECEGEGEPEACGTCFPFFDDARIARRLAIAKAKGPAMTAPTTAQTPPSRDAAGER